MTIEEILQSGGSAEQIISALKEKSINVPVWGGNTGMGCEVDHRKHPAVNKTMYH